MPSRSTIDGSPGFETFENNGKHGSLWLVIAKRYILQIEITAQDASELQAWLKRIDLKGKSPAIGFTDVTPRVINARRALP